MTDFALRNARRAGVEQALELKTMDALQRPPPAPRGTILMNPPYGERIDAKGQGSGGGSGFGPRSPAAAGAASRAAAAGARQAFEGGGSSAEFFGGLAAHWKRQYSGWTAWLLSPDPKLPGLMRLQESRRVPLRNGAIECRLFRFELVAGAHGRQTGGGAAGHAPPPAD
jgi:putative N6-adenine-specific DNA methylase